MIRLSELVRILRLGRNTEVSRSLLRKVLFSSNAQVRGKFKKAFGSEIEKFVEAVFDAYTAYKVIDSGCIGDKRKTYVAGFLFSAVNNLVSSFHLLISGYLIPSGNLMRQFFESASVAILFSKKELGFFERLQKEGGRFPAHKAVEYVTRHVGKFNINRSNWERFAQTYKFYDSHSHASPFALASLLDFSTTDTVFLGSGYDQKKDRGYRKEIAMHIDGARCLSNIIEGIRQELP